ncbi:hypothetical protein [Rubrivirga marina]|uniref:Peptidase M41 domain-containing protein n=1 Tax=Rubrivirga marina TaxID=1196024 RepID=A0A271IYK1_9BACT|nr:hypothetical protein [Rubrivirga marina]PAP76331.1 hypothetical protein BSZ37_07680 [Rubrivirga marina]
MAILGTAYHEAGHAVVDFDHGNLAGTVTIVPDADRHSAGSSQAEEWDSGLGEGSTGDDGVAAIEAKVVALYAGLEAERLVDPGAVVGAGDDYEKVQWHADLAGLDDVALDALRHRAAEHVARRRDVIARLARVLVDLQTLDQFQVECVIEGEPFRTGNSLRSPLYTAHLSEGAQRRYEEARSRPKQRVHIPPFDPDDPTEATL